MLEIAVIEIMDAAAAVGESPLAAVEPEINDILADIIDDLDFLEEIPDEAEIPNEANIPEQAEMPEDAVLDREILVDNDALFGPDEEELMGDVVVIAPVLNVADIFRKDGAKCGTDVVIAAACENFVVPAGWIRLE